MHYVRHRISWTLNRDNMVSGRVNMGQKGGIPGKFQMLTNRMGNFLILPFLISTSGRLHVINGEKTLLKTGQTRKEMRNDVGMEIFHTHFFYHIFIFFYHRKVYSLFFTRFMSTTPPLSCRLSISSAVQVDAFLVMEFGRSIL